MAISTEDILSEIKLPDYKGRHVFTAKLRLVIFVVFWVVYAIYFEGSWQASLFIPIGISLAFLVTGICYNNILKSRAIVWSFLLEMTADLFSITLIVYMTGSEKSQFFTFYILYVLAAGTFYSNLIGFVSAILSFLYFGGLVLLLHLNVIAHFHYPVENLFISEKSSLSFFLNFFLLTIFLPIIVYGTKIANYFSRIKERALEDRNNQLVALNRISSTIKGILSTEKAVRKVLSGVTAGLGYDICFLVIPSKKENTIAFYAPRKHEVAQKIEEILGMPISSLKLPYIENNFVYQSIKRHKIIFQDDLYELVRGIEPPITQQTASRIQKELGFKKFIVTPLVAERKVVGALIGATQNRVIDELRIDVLENFSNQAALAIESAQLFEELRQKNIDLEQANKIKGEFLAIMSHELRTPLTAVIGFSELLLEEVMGELNKEQKEYLKEVVHNSEHLLHLINSILDLSKVESGRMDLNIESFDLKQVVEDVKSSMQPLLKKKSLFLEVNFDSSFSWIEADQRKIRQILLNLLSNGIKFTSEGGKLTIQVHYSKNLSELQQYPVIDITPFELGYYKISIQDTGIGMHEKDLENIFDPFSQVDSSYTRRYQGTGLGLTLTKQFIEMHQGIIWVESEYSKGSCFHILLPAKKPLPEEESGMI